MRCRVRKRRGSAVEILLPCMIPAIISAMSIILVMVMEWTWTRWADTPARCRRGACALSFGLYMESDMRRRRETSLEGAFLGFGEGRERGGTCVERAEGVAFFEGGLWVSEW